MASSFKLPPSESVPQLSQEEQVKILDLLFEPCDELHALSLAGLRTTRFQSYDDLSASVGRQLYELASSTQPADTARLDAILSAHPRLGEKRVDSAQSKSEQAHLKSGDGDDAAEKLRALNAAYERAFPGLRYVVFVNGRARSDIFDNMQRRIDRANMDLERREAIRAMCDIARDRASKLLDG